MKPQARYAEYYGLNAAECYFYSNNADSAFYFLKRIVEENQFSDTAMLNRWKDVDRLKALPNWAAIENRIILNSNEKEKRLNRPLKELLESLCDTDQRLRIEGDSIDRTYGYDSPESMSHWKRITEMDSLNMLALEEILQQHGWPGEQEVGAKGNMAVWLIIQHANYDVQKKYLPVMRAAVSDGKASPSELAMLEDRLAINEGRKQIYGSQVGRDETTGQFYFLPIEDESNVDQRRESVGLEPLEYYGWNWGIKARGEGRKD